MKRFLSILLILVMLSGLVISVSAANRSFRIDDQAELLTESERETLQSKYEALTKYVNAAFVSADSVSGSTDQFAKSYVEQNFSTDPAVIFVIDMDNRELYIYSNRKGLRFISKADSRAITDNIYSLASNGDYYGCADAALSQILTRCKGGQISRPVKHITNALIAVVLGVLLNFLLAAGTRAYLQRKKVTAVQLRNMAVLPEVQALNPVLLKSEKHYHSSGSGTGSRGGGGGGFGGGGGGGGHRF